MSKSTKIFYIVTGISSHKWRKEIGIIDEYVDNGDDDDDDDVDDKLKEMGNPKLWLDLQLYRP